jgi:hypothetical protein
MYTYVLYNVHKAWWWPVVTAETCSSVEYNKGVKFDDRHCNCLFSTCTMGRCSLNVCSKTFSKTLSFKNKEKVARVSQLFGYA